ncbi:MAG: pyridoxamine 5'-phosphate oxidase family protein [Elusimicrobiota bacterium]|jgi:general stress protein 26|nr:pyridoxamine 5'-phosphate oxidase family protein [Elusimicrobiota bacterium]
MAKDLYKLGLMIFEKSNNSFIASLDEEGYPNLKAMLKPRENDGLKNFYLTTNTSSKRVQQYLNNKKSAVYFCDENFFLGIMLIGEMEVILDQKIKDRIWRNGDELYYPKGIKDPDYCVLKFVSKKARIYENFKSYNFEIEN